MSVSRSNLLENSAPARLQTAFPPGLEINLSRGRGSAWPCPSWAAHPQGSPAPLAQSPWTLRWRCHPASSHSVLGKHDGLLGNPGRKCPSLAPSLLRGPLPGSRLFGCDCTRALALGPALPPALMSPVSHGRAQASDNMSFQFPLLGRVKPH